MFSKLQSCGLSLLLNAQMMACSLSSKESLKEHRMIRTQVKALSWYCRIGTCFIFPRNESKQFTHMPQEEEIRKLKLDRHKYLQDHFQKGVLCCMICQSLSNAHTRSYASLELKGQCRKMSHRAYSQLGFSQIPQN
jgi:hypothetical protein